MFLTAIFVFSDILLAIFRNSLRLSSVSCGRGNLIRFPSIIGLIPKSDSLNAFSTSDMLALSQISIFIVRGSGVVIFPSWLIFIFCPYASILIESSILGDALPARIPCMSDLKDCIEESIRLVISSLIISNIFNL